MQGEKKILHLISGLEIGGAETQLLRILPELQKYHESRVCCVRGHGPIGKQLEEKGVPVHYLEFCGLLDLSVIYRFYKVIQEFQPDILVTYLIHADLYGRVLGRLFGIKTIVSSKRGLLLQWEWLAFFDRLTKGLVAHYLVQTEKAKKEWMERLRLPNEKKFTVIPNGIDASQFQIDINKAKKKTSLGIPEDAFVISCVSRLRRKKGHEYLLNAFEQIVKKHKNTTLLLVGDGEREDELKKQIAGYTSRGAIRFLGNRTDVPEILAITDIFVLPTEGEGMSNAIIEAMTSGKAIITTQLPENQELIDNQKTGILVTVKNTTALTDSLEFLMSNEITRSSLAENAKLTAERKFDSKTIAINLADFYNKI